MDIFKLVGSVFVDTEKANESLSKTDEKAQKTGLSLSDIGKSAAGVATAVVGATTAVVAGVVDMANNTAAAADVIDKASIRMNMTAEDYQRLSYAAGQCGVEMTVMEKAAKKLEGTGIDMTSAMEQVMAMATAEERAAKAAELFGERVAYEMSPLIEQSTESYDDLIERADELGLVMSGEDVTAAVVLGDTISDVTQAFSMLVTKLGTAVVPIVQMFADKILEFLPYFQSLFERIAPIVTELLDYIVPPIFELADTLLPVIFELIDAFMPTFTALAQSIFPLVVNLMSALLPILKPILDLITPILSAVLELVKPLLDVINLILPPLIELIVNGLGKALTFIGGIFTKVFDGIKNGLKAGLNAMIGFLNKMIDGANMLIAPLATIIAAVGNLFGAKWEAGNIRIPNIPMLAKGGNVTGSGAAIVGEAGPELVQLNAGARVTPLNGSGADALEKKLDTIISELEKLSKMGVYINGKRLVGEIATDMDRELGRLAMEG